MYVCLSGEALPISALPSLLHYMCSPIQSLNKKRADLRAVQQKLADLRAQFDENMAKKEQLEKDVDMCTKKLDRYTDTLLHTQIQWNLRTRDILGLIVLFFVEKLSLS